MSAFTDKYKSDRDLQVNAVTKRIRQTLPTHAESFAKRVLEDIAGPAGITRETLASIR